MSRARAIVWAAVFAIPAGAFADEPATSYIFPAGGRRGTTVQCRVGGMNLSAECGFATLGTGVEAPSRVRSMPTLVLVGPYHQNPVAQQAWDYPKDMAAAIRLAEDAAPGVRYWYCTTAEGATALRPFVVGDLPEVLEDEEKTALGRPQQVTLPVTVNGRVYPRADLDEYAFTAKAGDHLVAEVLSQRLGHKLDARLELFDAEGRPVASNDDRLGQDPLLTAVLPSDGRYTVRIHDIAFEGNQDYVYRLTLRVGPLVTHVFPAGGRRGERLRVRCYGSGLGPGGFLDRDLDGATTLPVPFLWGDLPEVVEGAQTPPRVTLPAALNGQILPAGNVDEYVFAGRKGEKWEFELFARRLGSPLAAVGVVADTQGKPLARLEGDGRFTFTAPEDGDYVLKVQEKHRETHGGSEYVYRVVASVPRPDFRISLEKDAVGVLPGQAAKIKVNVSRLSEFAGEVRIFAEGLPAGVEAAPVVALKQNSVELALKAAADARIGETRRATVFGEAVLDGKPVRRAATVPAASVESLAVTVVHPPLFSIATEEILSFGHRGTIFPQKFTVERQPGFDGEIEVRLADRQARYLQGATGPTMILKPGEREFTYPLFLPEGMDLNRTSRAVLLGTAKVKDGYVTHTTKKQIVVRVSPSLLALSAERDFVELAPGQTARVTLRLGRAPELSGAVTVTPVLPPDGRGFEAVAAHVPGGESAVTLAVRAAPGAKLGDADRVLFRAVAERNGHPVVAEASVRILLDPR